MLDLCTHVQSSDLYDGLNMNAKQLLELMDYCCPTYLGPSQSLKKQRKCHPKSAYGHFFWATFWSNQLACMNVHKHNSESNEYSMWLI